eukprot:jgi/Mesvir1/2822/Mv25445-RA.1
MLMRACTASHCCLAWLYVKPRKRSASGGWPAVRRRRSHKESGSRTRTCWAAPCAVLGLRSTRAPTMGPGSRRGWPG